MIWSLVTRVVQTLTPKTIHKWFSLSNHNIYVEVAVVTILWLLAVIGISLKITQKLCYQTTLRHSWYELLMTQVIQTFLVLSANIILQCLHMCCFYDVEALFKPPMSTLIKLPKSMKHSEKLSTKDTSLQFAVMVSTAIAVTFNCTSSWKLSPSCPIGIIVSIFEYT